MARTNCPHGREAAEVDLERGQGADGGDRRVGERQQVIEAGAQLARSLAVLDAEDSADDHVERDALQHGVDADLPTERQGIDRPLRDLAHRVAVGDHALAVEGRQHETSLAQVAVAVEHEERVPAEERPELCVRFACRQVARVGGHDLAHRLRVAEEHVRRGAGEA